VSGSASASSVAKRVTNVGRVTPVPVLATAAASGEEGWDKF